MPTAWNRVVCRLCAHKPNHDFPTNHDTFDNQIAQWFPMRITEMFAMGTNWNKGPSRCRTTGAWLTVIGTEPLFVIPKWDSHLTTLLFDGVSPATRLLTETSIFAAPQCTRLAHIAAATSEFSNDALKTEVEVLPPAMELDVCHFKMAVLQTLSKEDLNPEASRVWSFSKQMKTNDLHSVAWGITKLDKHRRGSSGLPCHTVMVINSLLAWFTIQGPGKQVHSNVAVPWKGQWTSATTLWAGLSCAWLNSWGNPFHCFPSTQTFNWFGQSTFYLCAEAKQIAQCVDLSTTRDGDTKIACIFQIESRRKANGSWEGINPINHPWCPLRGPLGSFPHSLLSTRKKNQEESILF